MSHLRSAALLRKLRVLSAWTIVANNERDREQRTSRKSEASFNNRWRFSWYISRNEFSWLASQSRRRFFFYLTIGIFGQDFLLRITRLFCGLTSNFVGLIILKSTGSCIIIMFPFSSIASSIFLWGLDESEKKKIEHFTWQMRGHDIEAA